MLILNCNLQQLCLYVVICAVTLSHRAFKTCSLQGERLSHAVGCAFAACLERKQKREKECGVTATFDASRTTFTREGSFRVTTATEQAEREEIMKQLQDAKKGIVCSTLRCLFSADFLNMFIFEAVRDKFPTDRRSPWDCSRSSVIELS